MSKKGIEEIVLGEDGIIKMPDINFEPNSNGLGDELFRAMVENGDRIAQIRASDGFSETYTALLTRCIRTALEMKRRMVTNTDIICLCTYNHINSCVPFIASLFIGAKVASVDPSQHTYDIAYLLNIVKPKMIFVIPEAVELIVSALEEASLHADLIVFGETDEHTPFSVFLEERGDEEENFKPAQVTSNQETAVVFFSSGTTGYPKGICINHYALVMQGSVIVKGGVTSSVILVYYTLYGISATILFITAIIGGSARVICSSFDPEKVWRCIDKYKVSLLFLTPIQSIEMCNSGRPNTIDTTSLLELLCGGGILPVKYTLLLRDLLPDTKVTQVYGQTEIVGGITNFGLKKRKDMLDYYEYKPSSCGRPIPGLWYKIVDPETEQPLTFNERGELRVKSKCQMNGYYEMDSSSCWDDDGFMKTGDIAYFDEDFCFYIVDRIKEVLKFKGLHVVPAVLEQVLLQHSAVKEVVVIGVPHDVDGDHALGVVVLKEDAADVRPEELEKFVEERVDDRQRLRAGVKIVDKLYYTPTGKVRRKYMKDLLLSGQL